jgi:hypothetical protein
MCRHGCPADYFCMVIFDTAREAAPEIQRHPWDKVLTDGHGLRGRRRKRLGGSHVHYR